MDAIDKKLLLLLQENARYSLKDLSEKVYLSSPAVASRIARLEKLGIISGYHAEISPEKLGYHITAYINIAMSPQKKATFKKYIIAFPNVLECSMVTGENTMIVKAMFASTSDLEDFIVDVQKFGKTETSIVFSEVIPYRGITVEETPIPGEEK